MDAEGDNISFDQQYGYKAGSLTFTIAPRSSLHRATEESGSEDVHQPVGNCISQELGQTLAPLARLDGIDGSLLLHPLRRTQAKRGRVLDASKAVANKKQKSVGE